MFIDFNAPFSIFYSSISSLVSISSTMFGFAVTYTLVFYVLRRQAREYEKRMLQYADEAEDADHIL